MTSRGLFLKIALCTVIVGCASRVGSYPTLIGAGILGLSTTNPYLGANVFLAGELEHSRFLFNFFKGNGAPTAIELIEPAFESTRLLMYYPAKREVYAADLQKRQGRREWIIRGPFAIEREDFQTLVRLEASLNGDPVFLLWGSPYRFSRGDPDRAPKVLRPEVPYQVPTPKPSPKRKPIVHKGDAKRPPEAQPTVIVVPPSQTLSSDQQALLMAKGMAERAPNGDLLHVVKGEHEKLTDIAAWYTGQAASAEEIAQVNGIQADAGLQKGSKIRIPAGLVKEPRAMAGH